MYMYMYLWLCSYTFNCVLAYPACTLFFQHVKKAGKAGGNKPGNEARKGRGG